MLQPGSVSSGIGEIGTNINNLSSTLTALKGGLDQLSTGASQLQTTAGNLETVSESLKAGAEGVYNGIGAKDTSGETSGIWGGIIQLQAGIDQIIGKDEELNGGAAALVEGFVHQPVNKEDKKDKPGLILGLAAYTNGVNEVNNGIQKLHGGALILKSSMQEIINGSKKLDAGAKTLASGA